MINKYKHQLEDIKEEILDGAEPLKVIGEYKHFFKKDTESYLGIATLLDIYMKKR